MPGARIISSAEERKQASKSDRGATPRLRRSIAASLAAFGVSPRSDWSSPLAAAASGVPVSQFARIRESAARLSR
jgi:hypothetical protein